MSIYGNSDVLASEARPFPLFPACQQRVDSMQDSEKQAELEDTKRKEEALRMEAALLEGQLREARS